MFVNIENSSNGIGIVTLVKKKFIVDDFVVGGEGRFIGVKLGTFSFGMFILNQVQTIRLPGRSS